VLYYFIFCVYTYIIYTKRSRKPWRNDSILQIFCLPMVKIGSMMWCRGHLNRADIHVDIDFHMSSQPSTSPKCLSCQAPEWCPIFESLKCSSRHNSPHGFVLKVSHPIFFARNTAWTNTIQHVIAVSDAEQHPDCVSTIWRWTKSQGHPKSHCM
jgi:hypothetical protein